MKITNTERADFNLVGDAEKARQTIAEAPPGVIRTARGIVRVLLYDLDDRRDFQLDAVDGEVREAWAAKWTALVVLSLNRNGRTKRAGNRR